MILTQFIVRCNVDKKSFADLWQIKSNIGESLNGFPCHFDIHISSIVIEFIEKITQIVLIRKFSQNLYFQTLYVCRLINFHIEILEIFLEKLFSFHVQNDIFYML